MKLDVVVPIYNAYTALKNCLASLEKNQYQAENIILINDASTDKNIDELLKKYSIANKWKLIKHEKNLGFVKTANEGLKLSENNTILLNSDTIVTKNWLSAFKEAIKHNEKLATATAWSNNAEICSFPQFLTNNQPLENPDILSELLYIYYHPQYPVIPTAVGFCMLITKLAKQKVGYFDEKHFGHGYGEENDYSLRAENAGLINILCDNAYVIHIGNESFADLGLQPNEDSMQRLLQKHPDYLTKIQQYINQDPLVKIRKNILSTVKQYNGELYQKLLIENKRKNEI
ncbi:MAG: glycosyltransferase family 2 protein [Alcanivoracaceae bacterium]|nr:glycosyltransferase family 2 protein [Alcanivoracaceae bacterium]